MESLINVIKREVKKINPLIWTVSFFLPLIMCLVICVIFEKGSPTNLPIAVMDSDNSEISRLFIRNLNSLPSCKIKYTVSNLNEGKQLLTKGKIYAFFAIPKDFQKDIYKMKQPSLLFYYNNQRILIGGIISKDVNMMVQTMLIGMDAKVRSKHGLAFSEAIKQSNLIKIDDHIRSNPYFNYMYFLSLVAFGHILQIHIVLTSVYVLGLEFKNGTTKDWLKTANNSIFIAVIGKLIPYFIIFITLFMLIGFTYFIILKAPIIGSIPIILLSSILFITACLLLGIIFISLKGNLRYGLSNAAFYVAMGFAFAGVTFPTMSMPLIAKIYSAILPLSYWIKIMLNQTLRNSPIIYDFKDILCISLLSILGLLFLKRLKNLAKDKNRWYQL